MDPTINRLQSVMEVLRRQIAESAQRLDVRGKPAATNALVTGTAKPPLQDIKRRIRERLLALSQNDPDRSKKARRLFVESVLAWEFGEDVMLDKRFDEMLDHVQEGLSAIPDVDHQFARLLTVIEQS